MDEKNPKFNAPKRFLNMEVNRKPREEQPIRKCSHPNVPGFCQDCGCAVYPEGTELYYERFQDVFRLGLLSAMKQIDSVSDLKQLEALKEEMYPLMRSLIEKYGCSIETIIEDIKTGKKRYK